MELETPALDCQWLDNNRIVIYTLSVATVLTITQWSELALQTIQAWPKDRPYLAMHDISEPGVGLLYQTAVQFDVLNFGVTPGGRKKFDELVRLYPDWPLSLALVVSHSLSGHIARLHTAETLANNPCIQTKVFLNRASALNWIRKS